MAGLRSLEDIMSSINERAVSKGSGAGGGLEGKMAATSPGLLDGIINRGKAIGRTGRDTAKYFAGHFDQVFNEPAREKEREKNAQALQDIGAAQDRWLKDRGLWDYSKDEDGAERGAITSDDRWTPEMDAEFKAIGAGDLGKVKKSQKKMNEDLAGFGDVRDIDANRYGADALRTMTTLAELGMGAATGGASIAASPLFNAAEGAVEGFADQLEQTKQGEAMDWGSAARRALVGAGTGVATAGLAKGMDAGIRNLAGKSGLLGGIGKFAAKATDPSGVIGSAVRGGVLGAAGGGLASGADTALQGGSLEDIMSATSAGVGQGLLSGAATGATMTGVGKAINKTAGAVAKGVDAVDAANTKLINKGAVNRLEKALTTGADGSVKFAKMTQQVFDDVNSIRSENGLQPLTKKQVTAYQNAINNNLGNRVAEGMSPRDVAQMAFNSLTSDDAFGVPGKGTAQLAVSPNGIVNDYDGSVINRAQDGGTSLQSIEPRRQSQINNMIETGQQKNAYDGQFGIAQDGELPTGRNTSIANGTQNVNTGSPATTSEAGGAPTRLFHGTPNVFDEFDNAAGSTWFTQSRDDVLGSGLSWDGKGKLNIMERDLPADTKLATWQDADRYGSDELINMGFDGIKWDYGDGQPVHYEIFNPNTTLRKVGATAPQAVSGSSSQAGNADARPPILSTQKTGKQVKAQKAAVQEMIQGFGTVPKKVSDKTKPIETFTSVARDMGLIDEGDIRAGTQAAVDVGSQIIRDTAGASGLIDTTDAQRIAKSLPKAQAQKVKDVMDYIIDSTDTSISGGKSGIDALNLQRQIESIAADAHRKGEISINGSPIDKITADNLYKAAETIGRQLDEATVANGALGAALDKNAQNIEALRNMYPDNQAWQKYVDNMINSVDSSKPLSSLRSSIKTPTRATIYIDAADQNLSTYGGRMPAIPTTEGGIRGVGLNYVANKVRQSAPVKSAIINRNLKIADGAGQNRPNAATSATAPTSASSAQIIGGIAEGLTGTPAQITGIQSALQNAAARDVSREASDNTGALLEEVMASTGTSGAEYATGGAGTATGAGAGGYGANMAYSAQTEPGIQTEWGYITQPMMAQAMFAAGAAGDTASYKMLAEMYNLVGDMADRQAKASAGSGKSLTATQQRANAAMSALDEVANMKPDAGFNLKDIPIIGGLATMGGNSYDEATNNLALQIGYMLSGANVPPGEQARIKASLVPEPFDSEETRQRKLQEAYATILQFQNVDADAGYASSLEEIMAAA